MAALDRPSLARRAGAIVVAFIAYAVAVGAALLTGPETGGLSRGVETVAAAWATWLGNFATVLPLGYAFGAGMVAAVNPCGFALLPAYLALYLGDVDGSSGSSAPSKTAGRLGRALWISLTVSAGFILLFGMAGLLLSVAAAALAQFLPWIGLGVGILLVLTGASLLVGPGLYISFGEQVAVRLGAGAQAHGTRAYFAYGLAYGIASLSCTLPIFLTVVGSALTVGGVVLAATEFVLYALGMGLVITALTLSTALFKATLVQKVRRVLPYVQPASIVLLLLAGIYIIYYWLTQGDLLALLRRG